MKKLYKYIVLVIGILAFSACTDETDFPSVAEEGTDVTLSLNFKPEIRKEIVNSRATSEENKLYDLHIYVFEPTREVNGQQIGGKLIGYEKLDFGDDGVIHENEPKTYSVNVRTKTGTSYIYALANINTGSIYKLSDQDNALLNVTTYATNNKTTEVEVNALRAAVEASTLDLATFKNINFNRTLPTGNEVISPSPIDNKFMMSGYLNDGNAVTIQKNGDDVSIQEDVDVIKLYRILAKNTLNIQSVGNGVFTLKSFRLHNVPVGGQLVPNKNISTANTAADYTTEKTTSANVESHYQAYSKESSFTFYYPENLQAFSSNITAWKDRETNDYSSGSKSFTNAPNKSAYIELQGDYIDKSSKITANVTYTIHLGNFSKSLNDFNVIRNNHYIYTVKVNGVQDIIVEATTTSDTNTNNNVENPYAEGLVVKVGSGEHLDLDAHYEARVLSFNKSSIEALRRSLDKDREDGPGYIVNITTPFLKNFNTVNVKNDGVYSMANTRICGLASVSTLFGDEYPDYRWMKFVKNTENNRTKNGHDISKYTCKYPGDDKNKYTYSADNGTKSVKYDGGWLNVFELLAELYDYDSYDTNGNAYYTCFIDENYYADKTWIEYVNKDPRTMQIANNLSISEDKKSVYAEVAYSISQRSIATFYKDINKVAFGTEILDEEDLYENRLGAPNNISLYENITIKDQHTWNGWTSAKNTNLNAGWYSHTVNNSEIVTFKQNIQPLYSSVAKACMSRNRDLNGDGDIDEGEVKWYLATIEQYHALYFAQKTLPDDSKLITTKDLEDIHDEGFDGWGNDGSGRTDDNGHDFRGAYHYYTSSPRNEGGTYWPEEGLTSNPVQSRTNGWVSRAELVRCVRTLQSATKTSSTITPQYGLRNAEKYYTFSTNTNGNYEIDLSGIETRRSAVDALINHNELQDQNELSKKFEISNENLKDENGRSDYSIAMNTLTSQSNDPCSIKGVGWRTPNQKELALMLSNIANVKNGNIASRTRFSGCSADKKYGDVYWHGQYLWHTKVGFVSNGNFNLAESNTSAKIRCVRDVK